MKSMNHLTINTLNNMVYLPTQRKFEMDEEIFLQMKNYIIRAIDGDSVKVLPNVYLNLEIDKDNTYMATFSTNQGNIVFTSMGTNRNDKCQSIIEKQKELYYRNWASPIPNLSYKAPLIVDTLSPLYIFTPQVWIWSGTFTKYLGWMILDNLYKEEK